MQLTTSAGLADKSTIHTLQALSSNWEKTEKLLSLENNYVGKALNKEKIYFGNRKYLEVEKGTSV